MRRDERPVGASPTTFDLVGPRPSREGTQNGYFFLSTERLWRRSVLSEDVCLHHRWLRFEQSGPHL
jgi:hypothetical protein